VLVGLFWVDIERQHPGIDTLQLPTEVAEPWKQRMRVLVLRDGRVKPRRFYLTRLVTVRAFYLDIAEWALEDPTWAPWAVPCPHPAQRDRRTHQGKAQSHRRHASAHPRAPSTSRCGHRDRQ
jgi:hypothetical protein